MLRIVSSVSRPTSTGFFGKVANSCHSPHYSACNMYFFRLLLFMVLVGHRTISSSSARNAEITLTVDGKEVTVPQGTLRACNSSKNCLKGTLWQALPSFRLVKLQVPRYHGTHRYYLVCCRVLTLWVRRFCYHDRCVNPDLSVCKA
jgi:hypothetical protein